MVTSPLISISKFLVLSLLFFQALRAAALPAHGEQLRQPSSLQAITNTTASNTVVSYVCRDSGAAFDYTKCYAALDEMRESPEYTQMRSTWSSDSSMAYRIWGSASIGCEIRLGCGLGNRVGHFTLKEVEDEVFVKLATLCPAKGGWGYFPTDNVPDVQLGWGATFFTPKRRGEDALEEKVFRNLDEGAITGTIAS